MWLCLQARDRRKAYRLMFFKLVLFTLFLVYPSVSRQVLAFLVCTNVSNGSASEACCGAPNAFVLRFIATLERSNQIALSMGLDRLTARAIWWRI